MRWVAKVSNCTPWAASKRRQRIGQADHADLDQVVDLDVGRQLGDHLVGQAAHQRAVLLQRRVQVELAFGGVHGQLRRDQCGRRGAVAAARARVGDAPAAAIGSAPSATGRAASGAAPGVRRLASASPAGSMRGPVAQHRAEEAVGAGRQLRRRCARRAASSAPRRAAGRCTSRPARWRQQLHRRVGVGHAVGPVVGEQRAGARPRRAGAALREQPAQLGRAGVDEHDVGLRRGLGDRLQQAVRSSRRRRRSASAGRARPGRRPAPTARSMHWPRSISAISPAGPARSAASTTSVLRAALGEARCTGARAARRRRRRAGSRPPARSAARAPANMRRRPSAWSLRRRAASSDRHGVWRESRSGGRGSARGARAAARLPRGAAKTRFTSAASSARPRCRRRAARAAPARCADRRCQSSGTRWPLATPTTFSLWRISGVERRAELDGLVDLATARCRAQLAAR